MKRITMKRIRQWLGNQSIQKKLIISNFFGSSISYIFVILIMLSYEYFALRNHSLSQLNVESDMVVESVAAAMAFQDAVAAEESLRTLRGADDILEAHLFLNDKTLFKSYYRNPKKTLPLQDVFNMKVDTFSYIAVKKMISLRSQQVGSLIIVASMKHFYTRLFWYMLILVGATSFGLYFATLIAVRISKMITTPLESLTHTTEKIMAEGTYSTPINSASNDEVGMLSRAFSAMISQIHERDESLKHLAYYDRVTGIANRHYFEERIAQSVDNATRYGTSCALLMLDLDDFKIVNDHYGHPVGDMLLKHVSETLRLTLRSNDVIFRIGGDEFAVIIESECSEELLSMIALKIIHAISQPVLLEKHTVVVGISIGISCFPKYSKNLNSLIRHADTAMYRAKSEGKNRYSLFTSKRS
jgi:diguanylate cyclase (GGDEF)-like protein